eukprot:gb/GEZN01001954.1/.p1 GENE.gb/GEZN01001954.1/~~gb/GEZN01001954.1/.p1  ORF type:complete len:777 (-),score=125.02 gb/GEZN01001954.1/:394-2490(-)
MSSSASYQDPNDPEKVLKSNLNILDLVKHAVRTVIRTLTPNDRIAIVAFDTKADSTFALGEMTEAGQAQAEQALSRLQPRNGTNLWIGLETGLDALRAPTRGALAQGKGKRKKCLLLLTDGQPTVSPPHGHGTALKEYKEKHPDLQCQVSTFGFGYKLDSKILLEIAHEGGGTFSFIPDAKILGTCFVDFVANAVSNLSQSAQLHLLLKNGATFAGPVLGDLDVQETGWGRVVELGSLQFGQPRDLACRILLPASLGIVAGASPQPYLEAVLVYANPSGAAEPLRVSTVCKSRQAAPFGLVALWRASVVTQGYLAIDDAENGRGQKANREWAAICGRVKAAVATAATAAAEVAAKAPQDGVEEKKGVVAGAAAVVTAEALKAESKVLGQLLEDVDGRMAKSINTPARFSRWGKHYLRAVVRAHQLQVCTNFMDAGLQAYGGTLFQAVRDQGGKIFVTLPAPTPSNEIPPEVLAIARQHGHQIPNQNQRRGQPAPAPAPVVAPAPPPDMGAYYAGAGGGCFHGSCTVTVQNAQSGGGKWFHRPICQIKAGDTVQTGEGVATVKALIKILRSPTRPLVGFPSGLLITPGHPIRLASGQWVRPSQLIGQQQGVTLQQRTQGDTEGVVYTVLLDQHHTLLVNQCVCVTWGHGLTDPAVYHPYLGTKQVVADLAAMPGWQQGMVLITGCVRDRATNSVVRLLG